MNRVQEGVDKPRPKVLFEPGEVVRVTDGPFNDFSGVVEQVHYEKSRLQVAVQILGRSTPVELDFGQVEKGLGIFFGGEASGGIRALGELVKSEWSRTASPIPAVSTAILSEECLPGNKAFELER